MKISKTKNYSIFSHNPNQRTFSEVKVAQLVEKMKRNGFPPSMAISVFQEKAGKYTINAGHHRLAAAKRLGIDVLYVVEHQWSVVELSDEGTFMTSWSLKDHVSNHAKSGNKDYAELLKMQDMGLNISHAASMFHGEQAGSGNAADYVKAGTFKIKDRVMVNKWLEIREEFGERVPCIFHRNFVSCWCKCMFTPEYDNEIFIKRLRANPTMLEKCNTEDQMMKLIEELYNFNRPKKIPLAFIVTRNSSERKVTSFGLKLKTAK
tara:strand:- start:6717 stop:7505 length:789 start_codon:yes stop_codon:yes gene_type:complete